MRRRRGVFALLLVVLSIVGAAVGVSQAGSLSDEPLGLRLGLAFDRASAFTDVVGLSASTAYPYPSAVNPAAGDFLREPPNNFTVVGTLTGNLIPFTGGATLTAGAVSGTFRPPGAAGTLIAAYGHVESHDASTHQGDDLVLRSNQLNLSYSYLVTKRVALGASLKLSETVLRNRSSFEEFPLRTETWSQGIEGGLGALVSLTDQWLVGALVGLGWTRAHTTGRIDFPGEPFAFGPVPIEFTDTTRSLNVRFGVGWRPIEAVGVYADGQYLNLRDVQIGRPDNTAEVGRMFAGVELMPVRQLALRVGGSADTDRQFTVSAGVGFYPVRYFQAELAYVYNAFPEVRKELGRAHLVSLSLVFAF